MKTQLIQFRYNPLQIKHINSILIGVVELKFNGQRYIAVGFLNFRANSVLLTFKINNKVRTVYIDHSVFADLSYILRSESGSEVLVEMSLIIDLDSGLDYSIATNYLFPECPSKLYCIKQNSYLRLAVLSGGYFQFGIHDLGLEKSKTISKASLWLLKKELEDCVSFDIDIYGAFVLTMLQLGNTKNVNLHFDDKEHADSCDSQAAHARQQFADYFFNLKTNQTNQTNQTNVSTIRVVKQESQKLLLPCLEKDNTVRKSAVEVEIPNKTDSFVTDEAAIPNEVAIPDEAYVYYDADFGYFENEIDSFVTDRINAFVANKADAFVANKAQKTVKTDDQDSSKETVINTNTNTNTNTEVNTMSGFKFDRSASCSFSNEDATSSVNVDVTSSINEDVTSSVNVDATSSVNEAVAAPISTPNVEVNAMQNSAINCARAKVASEAAVVEVASEAAVVEVETSPKVAQTPSNNKVLASVEIVVNITMTSRLIPSSAFGTIQDKNKGAIINTRSCGLILKNKIEDSAYATFRPLPEIKQDSYGNNNMAVVIFHYVDGSQEILDVKHTIKFWNNVLGVTDISSTDINFLVKTQFKMDAETLEEGIREGNIRAYSIKFENLDSNMFANPQSSAFSNVLTLPVARNIWATPLRNTVEVAQKGQKFVMSSKFFGTETVADEPIDYKLFMHRSDSIMNSVTSSSILAQNSATKTGASFLFGEGDLIPNSSAKKTVSSVAPKASVTVETVVAPVVVDEEKVALRKENAELKLEISSLKLSVEAMNASMVALTAAVQNINKNAAAPIAVVAEIVPVTEVVTEVVIEVVAEEVVEVVVNPQEELNNAVNAAKKHLLVATSCEWGANRDEILEEATRLVAEAEEAAKTPEEKAADAVALEVKLAKEEAQKAKRAAFLVKEAEIKASGSKDLSYLFG